MKMITEGDFPVTFFDGEREIRIGNVRVKSSLTYKTFQMGLSQRIGISPNQITVYLISAGAPATPHRKIPITNKFDFSLLVRETGAYFLVVLKRTRRNRRPVVVPPAVSPVAAEKRILRRSEAEWMRESNMALEERRILSQSEAEWMREVERRESDVVLGVFPTIGESLARCGECDVARRFGTLARYHPCLRDAVVVGFRSTAGPIAPPHQRKN